MAESRKKPLPKRKTPAQKLDAIVLRALAEYGRYCREYWLPLQPEKALEYRHAQRAIRRVLREVARG